MKMIIFFTGLTIFLLYTLGLGITRLIIPSRLRAYTIWLSPWYLIVLLIFVLVVMSLLGLSVDQVALPIFLILMGINYYVFKIKKYRIPFNMRDDLGTMVLVGISILVSITPLLLKTKFLTTLTLGNNDIIAYSTTADFLRHYSLVTGFRENITLPIANLLRDGFRWGTPIIQSFFLSLYNLRGYQLSYLLQVILFSIMAPLTGVLASFLTKRSFRTIWFATFLTLFNVNMLYMLYHDFFGQVMYWGIALLLTLLCITYFTSQQINLNKFNIDDVIIGLIIVVLFYTYHEPVIFIILPLILYAVMTQVKNLKRMSIQVSALLRIAGVSLLIGSYSIINALIFDFTQAFLGNPDQPIGWQLFRKNTSFASPFEAVGMWSIHNFLPLSITLSVILSLLVCSVIGVGLWKLRFRLIYVCYILIYIFFYYWTGIYQGNFFFYNRALTYTLPFILILYVSGWESLFHKNRFIASIGVCITVVMVSWSAANLNLRFINESVAVDLSYVSIDKIKQLRINEPIYTTRMLSPDISIWNQIWIEYFLYPNVNDGMIPKDKMVDNSLVLLNKSTAWIKYPSYLTLETLWRNEYYQLSRICLSDECIIKYPEELSQIIFGKSEYEDSLLISGWSVPEKEGRWAVGKESSLKLITKQPTKTLVTEVASLAEPQEMSIQIDGKEIGTKPIMITKQRYEYQLPSVLVEGIHTIMLKFTHTYQPSIILGNQDQRDLAARFFSIKLE